MENNPYQQYVAEAFAPSGLDSVAGKVCWQSPSNIAIVKYWGKYGLQLPRNPSISFTLNTACTETSIAFESKHEKGIEFLFRFEGQPKPAFEDKIGKYLHSLLPYFPFLEYLSLKIDSHNSFPHSSGIASSASSMSALVMCLLDLEQQLSGHSHAKEYLLSKASYLARLGSGSASRSVMPFAASWGVCDAIADSSQYFATPLAAKIHEQFKTYHDSILIISGETKKVSSRAGHALMDNNPFANIRYEMARQNTERLFKVLQAGDAQEFCRIAEAEALQLHALMLTSNPCFVLLEAQSLSAIKAVQAFREETGIPLCFTLDAGPNLHLLYPDDAVAEVKSFIQQDLTAFCHQGEWIDDRMGSGPSKIV